ITLDEPLARRGERFVDKPVVFGIRPEDVTDVAAAGGFDPQRTATVNVEVSEPMGHETYLYLSTEAHSFIARVRSSDQFDANQAIKVGFKLEHAHLFDATTESVIV